MTEPDSPSPREDSAHSSGALIKSEKPASQSRRRVLQTITGGGSLLLAGCGQNNSSSQTGGQGGSGTDQTFRAPIEDDPSKTTFLTRHAMRPESLYGWQRASISLQRFILETGVWPDGLWVGNGSIYHTWIEDPIEIEPTEITVSIRDDAQWSDGQQISGKDIATIPISQSIRRFFAPYYAQDGPREPRDIYTAFDGFDLTDQSVTYRSSAGHFDTFWDSHLKKRFGTFFGPHLLPTHVEPYDAYADAVIETANRAQQGEISPWKPSSNAPYRRHLVKKHVRGKQYAEKFSKAENVLSTGAWDLVEIRDSQGFVFEPNQYHRNATDINFETLILEYTPPDRSAGRQHAALKADRLDYGSTVTPLAVVESLPDHIKQLQVPGGIDTGNELNIGFDHQGMGKRDVRAAIMYALDHQTIANNIHPSAAVPFRTPGGDCWDATDWAGQDWLATNLTTYERNLEKASTLMREAGFTNDNGLWIGTDGKPITLTIATKNSTPRWEPTVASQLSEFGIQTSVRSFNETTFSQRHREFPLRTDTAIMTNNAPNTLAVWWGGLIKPEKYDIYPEEQFANGEFSLGGEPVPKTEARWSDFTIEAPPIGQPDGPLQEYSPAVLPLSYWTNPPEEEFRRRVKTGMWLANWFLPILPITKKLEQHFIDEAHWLWPRNTPSWNHFTGDGFRSRGGFFATGTVRANPDNPEE